MKQNQRRRQQREVVAMRAIETQTQEVEKEMQILASIGRVEKILGTRRCILIKKNYTWADWIKRGES